MLLVYVFNRLKIDIVSRCDCKNISFLIISGTIAHILNTKQTIFSSRCGQRTIGENSTSDLILKGHRGKFSVKVLMSAR